MLKELKLTVNGEAYELAVKPNTLLLDLLNSVIGLKGAIRGCDSGSCGACTVLLDGEAVKSCSTLALQADGKEITTIEGLADGDQLHPVQEAFIEEDAIQCGFCTPGFVMSMAATLQENPSASLEEIKEGISGHVCRCGSYPQMFKAAESAKKKVGG